MTQVDFRLFQSQSCWDFDQSILMQYIGGQVCVNSCLVVMWAVRWAGPIKSGGCYFSCLRRNDLIRSGGCNPTGQIDWIHCDEI